MQPARVRHPYDCQPYYLCSEPPADDGTDAGCNPAVAVRASTPLDTLETSGHDGREFGSCDEVAPGVAVVWDPQGRRAERERTLPESDEPGTCFRHSGWQVQRKRVYMALAQANSSRSRRDSFASCGQRCFILQSAKTPTEYKLAARCCHDRFCVPCANERSRCIANNVLTHLEKQNCRFVTLTLRADGLSLSERVDRLLASFKRLRKTDLWSKTQTGGVAFLEVKHNAKTANWHPHLHILTQGKFIRLDLLKHAWFQITGDSSIVDVRAVTTNESAIAYVTKYASKPLDRSIFETDQVLCEAVSSLVGRRLMSTFGNWKGLQLTERPNADEWITLGSLNFFCVEAAKGVPDAERILRIVCGDKAEALIEAAKRHYVPPLEVFIPPEEFKQLSFI